MRRWIATLDTLPGHVGTVLGTPEDAHAAEQAGWRVTEVVDVASLANVPNSPIAGEDEVPYSTGRELRRARAVVEVVYHTAPDEFVDIQAQIFDAMEAVHDGEALYAVDLTEHVVLEPDKEAR